MTNLSLTTPSSSFNRNRLNNSLLTHRRESHVVASNDEAMLPNQVKEDTQTAVNLFQETFRASAKKDETSINLILKKQHLRNQMVGELFHAAQNGAVNSIKDNLSTRQKKWDAWTNSEPKHLNNLISWWEKKYTGVLKQALVMFGKFLGSVIYYPIKFSMQGINSILRSTANADTTLSRIQIVRVMKHFAAHPEEGEMLEVAIAEDIKEQKECIDENLPYKSRAQADNIQKTLKTFSIFIFNNKKKSSEDIRANTITMLQMLLEIIQEKPENSNKNDARLFIKEMINSTNRLSNELELIHEEKNKLIDCYFFACAQFVDLLFQDITFSAITANENAAVSALKNMTYLHISNAVLLSSYEKKNFSNKASVWMWRTISPVSAFFSKAAGIGGAAAAGAKTFITFGPLYSLGSIPIIGSLIIILVSSIPFVIPEIILMIIWAKLARDSYHNASEKIVKNIKTQTQGTLMSFGFSDVTLIQEKSDEEKAIDKNKRTTSRQNRIRSRLSKIRDFKPASRFKNRLLLISNITKDPLDNTNNIKEAHLKADEIDNTIKILSKYRWMQNISGYKFIEKIESGEFAQEMRREIGAWNASMNKFQRADFRAKHIKKDFFDKIIKENWREINITIKINEIIALSHELTNLSDDMSIYTWEKLYERIHKLSHEVSELIIEQNRLTRNRTILPTEIKALKIYLQYHIIYFASVLTNNMRTKTNKSYRYSGFAVMPATNFGVLKGESVAIVKFMENPSISPFSTKNLAPELGAGMVLGGSTLAGAGALSLALMDKGRALDKQGIYKVNPNSSEYIQRYLKEKIKDREETIRIGENLQNSISILGNNYEEKEQTVKINLQINRRINNSYSNFNQLKNSLNYEKNRNTNKFLIIKATSNLDNNIKLINIECKFIDSLMEIEEGYLLFPIVESELKKAREDIDKIKNKLKNLPILSQSNHERDPGFIDEFTDELVKSLDS